MEKNDTNRDGLIVIFAGGVWWGVGNKFDHLGSVRDLKDIQTKLQREYCGEIMSGDKRTSITRYDLHMIVKKNEGTSGKSNSMKVVLYNGKFVVPMSEKFVPLDEFLDKNKNQIKYLRFFKPGVRSVLMENPLTGRAYNFKNIPVKDSFRDDNSFISEIQMDDEFDKLKHCVKQRELYADKK